MITDFWSNKRPAGFSETVDFQQYNSLQDVITKAFSEFGERPAFTCLGKTVTYGEVDRLSLAFATWLQNHTSLKPGDAFAIQLPNLLQYPVAVYGALRAGLVLVNTNPLYTLTELKHQLVDSGAKAIICLEAGLELVAEASAEAQVEQVITTGALDLVAGFSAGTGKVVDGLVVTTLGEVLSAENPQPYITPEASSQSSLCLLQYTGGTTGVAKGAMLTHGNIIANVVQMCDGVYQEVNDAGELLIKPGEQVVVAPLPLYHIYSFTMNLMLYPSRGDHTILIPNPRDIDQFIDAIQPFPFTLLVGLNTLFAGLMAHPRFKECDFSRFSMTLSGGTALQLDIARRWEAMTGSPVIEGFGLTETSPIVCSGPLGEGRVKPGSVGMPVPATELKTVREDGTTAGVNEPGELCVRGPQVMAGYWQRPEATAEVIDTEGWFHTGDVAVIDEAGYVSIVDRLKDMILVSGFNVYPNEVENVASHCPGVQLCAAIGVPDDKTGEAVRLFVVRSDAALTEETVIQHCRQHLTGYKIPHQIVFRDSLPMTAVGKVLRKELRKEAQEVAEAL
ncbi:AMP-binding protein [Parendozoicomonas haliclonae]|uniref:Long-chain-fatty-acid--CoA ligase n=1 Tax=Parendozoicomonas haliclonae TaxID=1960125 RepID=A0A1X7AP69_9GAMM|nr:AMP-binding protein [Parendozoicomonas haliclonae]SMA49943.1 Long-chain-fatty-acid-CoA ligase [Parendozoicomonas haliclonae]